MCQPDELPAADLPELELPEFPLPPPKKKKTVLDAQKRSEVCAILAMGGTRATAAEYVGCHPDTIRRTARREPEFADQISQAQSRHEMFHLRSINAAAGDTRYWRAAAWALEHIYPDRYARKAGSISPEQIQLILQELAESLLKHLPDNDERRTVRAKIVRIAEKLQRLYGEETL
jgi:hypothetical protein